MKPTAYTGPYPIRSHRTLAETAVAQDDPRDLQGSWDVEAQFQAVNDAMKVEPVRVGWISTALWSLALGAAAWGWGLFFYAVQDVRL